MERKILVIIFFLISLIFVFFVILSEYSTPELKGVDGFENGTFEKKENPFFTHEIIKYFTTAEITEFEPNASKQKIGVNVDQNYIGFGKIPQTSGSKRTLVLNNTKDISYRIRFFVYGNISGLVSFGRRDFLIKPGEGIEVPVNLNTYRNSKPGIYTGEIGIVISIPKNLISKSFQRWV